MTTFNEDEWEIKALQTRFEVTYDIELNIEQAVKMLGYEQELNSGYSKYFFSVWEELDYEQVNFKEILTTSQFQHYISGRADRIKRMEDELIENDIKNQPYVNAAEERLAYCKSILLPSLRKNLLPFSMVFNSQKEKVDFLKSEYRKYLLDTKRQMLIKHFRHSKTFQPILLKLSLLRYEEMCWNPDYLSFLATMDTATKTVSDFVLEKLLRISDNLADALKQTMDDFKEFNTNNAAKHIGTVSGWHVPIQIHDNKEELMFAVILDPDRYNASVK